MKKAAKIPTEKEFARPKNRPRRLIRLLRQMAIADLNFPASEIFQSGLPPRLPYRRVIE